MQNEDLPSSCQSSRSSADLKTLVTEALREVHNRLQHPGSIMGLPTGFRELDKMTDGLHAGDMIVIAARPSMGKTALALSITEHIAVEQQRPVAIFSLAMSRQQLVQRLLCSRSRVSLAKVRDGLLNERDLSSLETAASQISASGIFIDDTCDLSITKLRSRAREMKRQHGITAMFVDYLQLLRGRTRRAETDPQLEITEISTSLKCLARELNIPVLVLVQLNRDPEQHSGESWGRPRLSDLCECGGIVQDADLVALLLRQEYYAESDEKREAVSGKATLIIAKQVNGPVGDVPLAFQKEFIRFQSVREN